MQFRLYLQITSFQSAPETMPPYRRHIVRRVHKVRPRTSCGRLLLLLLLLLPGFALRAQEDDSDMRLPGGQMLRGTVTAVRSNALTLKDIGGELYQVTTTDNTRIVHDRQTAKFTDIKIGDCLGAGGILDAPTKTLHAAFLAVIDAEEVRRAQADFGKTYIAGKITAIDLDTLKLTVLRLDNVKQVIAVDETTSFRRGGRNGGLGFGAPPAPDANPRKPEPPTGESITLADIKVGDSVVGRGALKNGTFLPSELRVSNTTHAHRNSGDAPAPARP